MAYSFWKLKRKLIVTFIKQRTIMSNNNRTSKTFWNLCRKADCESCNADFEGIQDPLLHLFAYVLILKDKNKQFSIKVVASKFMWPMEPPVWADLFLTWHRDYLVSLILIFIIFGGITMHYNAFLAVLFLRVILYGPQNLVSFKKFPCTDGLGLTETATSCTATQVIPFEKYEWLRDSKSIIWNWILHSESLLRFLELASTSAIGPESLPDSRS